MKFIPAFVAKRARPRRFHSDRYQRTKSGRMIVFQLPGGKTLHVQPRAIDGGMIAMEVVLFDGTRTYDDGQSEAPERRHLRADRTAVQRRHAAPADQPDQGGERIYPVLNLLAEGTRVTCRPRPTPAKAIANATTPMMQSRATNCAIPCAVVC